MKMIRKCGMFVWRVLRRLAIAPLVIVIESCYALNKWLELVTMYFSFTEISYFFAKLDYKIVHISQYIRNLGGGGYSYWVKE